MERNIILEALKDLAASLRNIILSVRKIKKVEEWEKKDDLGKDLRYLEGEIYRIINHLEKVTAGERFRKLEFSNEDLKGFVKRLYVLKDKVERFDEKFAISNSKLAEVREEVFSFFTANSLGFDQYSAPISRYLQTRLYISQAEGKKFKIVADSIERLCSTMGLVTAENFPAQEGSWWKRWFFKTREIATQPEIAERLKKIERAIKLKGLDSPQSQIDKNEAEAVAQLIISLKDVPSAVLQLGSLLVIKLNNTNGEPCIHARNLTHEELAFIERNQNLLHAPEQLLLSLSSHHQNAAPLPLQEPGQDEI